MSMYEVVEKRHDFCNLCDLDHKEGLWVKTSPNEIKKLYLSTAAYSY